jgi:predicted nucleic acid-binding protein
LIGYIDTSALVKRYVDEPGAEIVSALRGPIVVSEIARVELASALWRRGRSGGEVLDAVPVLLRAFEADVWADDEVVPAVQLVRVDGRVISGAARAVARHDLGSLDALHLATAELVRAAGGEPVVMVAFDRRLRVAAAAEGFALHPPTLN